MSTRRTTLLCDAVTHSVTLCS